MMKIGEFVLVNDEKIERALHGTITRGGKLEGGVQDLPENATEEETVAHEAKLIAEYDRLGGFISKDGIKVKTGSFYDFAKRCPRAEPELSYLTELDGEIVEVDEEEAKAVKAAKDKTLELKEKKAKKLKKSK